MASRPLATDPRRLRTSARFLLRSLSLRHSTFLVALLAVTVAATLAASLLGLQADLRNKLSAEMRGFGPNLIITPAPGAVGALLDEEEVRRVEPLLRRAGMAPGAGPSGILLAAGRARERAPAAAWENATIVGADLRDLARLNPSWRLEGRWPDGDSGCVAGGSLAGKLEAKNGSFLDLEIGSVSFDCKLTGTLITGESEEEEILVPLARLQKAIALPGRVSLATLWVEGNPPTAKRAARVIEKAIHGSQARVVWQVAAAQGELLGKLERLAVSLSLTVFLLCGLCVMTTLLSLVLEREPEIGLMRSLGAGDGEILAMFLGEVTLLGVLGAGLGLGLGLGAARLVGHHLFETRVVPRLEIVPPVLAVSLIICWLSVLLPLKRALAIRPADALRGN
ncbi:MAG TPA: ABC transporter permease [Candidatus Polarisedimenticolia bacterium]|nr:ABC transporter permease [Candidatus Polarisedimenticolia bacterium]